MSFSSVAHFIGKKTEAKNPYEGVLRSHSSLGSEFRSFLGQLENEYATATP